MKPLLMAVLLPGNSSVEELEKFIGGMIEVDNDDEEEVEEEEEVSFTTAATPRETTERSKKERGGSRGGGLGSSASLPVCLVRNQSEFCLVPLKCF